MRKPCRIIAAWLFCWSLTACATREDVRTLQEDIKGTKTYIESNVQPGQADIYSVVQNLSSSIEALKAEIGRPSVEATPASPAERDAVVGVLVRFGEEIPSQPGTVAVRLSGGASGLADVVRALDAENLKVSNLRLEEPSLDDVFLAKTGRSLEGAGDDGEETNAEEARA